VQNQTGDTGQGDQQEIQDGKQGNYLKHFNKGAKMNKRKH